MSVQTAQNEVSTAIYHLLTSNDEPESGLATLGVLGVFDMRAVPQNQDFPYITIGDSYEMPDNTFGRRCYTLNYTIHVWSRERGTMEAASIVDRINQLIDQQPLTLATHAHVFTMYDRSIYLNDPDGLTLHVAARYKIRTEEA